MTRTSYEYDPKVPAKHYYCKDCGAKLFGGKRRAVKHENKTGHTTEINWVAESAHRKYKAREASKHSYLGRLIEKDRGLNG